MQVRERLQQLLDERGWNQSELARRLVEHRNWVNNRLTGETAIKADELPRLAVALGVRPCDFFEDATPPITSGADRLVTNWAQRVRALEDEEIDFLTESLAQFLRAQRNRQQPSP